MTAQVHDAATGGALPASRTRFRGARTLLRDRAAFIGLALLVVITLASILRPLIAPAGPDRSDFLHTLEGPSLQHLLGTDELGRDELARLLQGARLSLGLAAIAALCSAAIGLALGLVAGFIGGLADLVIMRVVDALQALPGLILALAVAGLLGAGIVNIVIAVIVVWWTGYARVVRSMVLSVRERQYVDAARGMGATRRWLVVRHVLPNVIGPAVVLASLEMAQILLALAALSFLGLGVTPPTPEWGTMLAGARDNLDRDPLLVILPGVAITLAAVACNLVGDGLRDALDPRLQRDVIR